MSWACVLVVACLLTFRRSMAFVEVCTKSMIFVDPNGGETYCYHITKFTESDFYENPGVDKDDWAQQTLRCNRTFLQLGRETRQASLVSMNSDEESKFIEKILLAASNALDDIQRGDLSKYVLLGVASKSTWLDGSNNAFLTANINRIYRWRNAKWTAPQLMFYIRREAGSPGAWRTWKSACELMTGLGSAADYFLADIQDKKEFKFCICKARFAGNRVDEPVGLFSTLIPPTSLGECNSATTLLYKGKQYCYSIASVTADDFKRPNGFLNERVIASERCQQTRVHLRDDKWVTALISVHSEEEVQFVTKLVKARVARMSTSEEQLFASRVLLGAVEGGWMDGTDAKFLEPKHLRLESLGPERCLYYLINKDSYLVGACGVREDFFPKAVSFVVCKSARYVSLNVMYKEQSDDVERRANSPWDQWRASGSMVVASKLLAVFLLLVVRFVGDV